MSSKTNTITGASATQQPTMILDTMSRQVLRSLKVQECNLELDKWMHDDTSDIYDYECSDSITIGDRVYNDIYVSVIWYGNKVEVWFQQTDDDNGYAEAELLGTVTNPELRLNTDEKTQSPDKKTSSPRNNSTCFDLRSKLKNAGFTQAEINEIISSCDGVQTDMELWAHWFACYGMEDYDFVSECTRPLLLSQEKAEFLLGIVHRVHNIQKLLQNSLRVEEIKETVLYE